MVDMSSKAKTTSEVIANHPPNQNTRPEIVKVSSSCDKFTYNKVKKLLATRMGCHIFSNKKHSIDTTSDYDSDENNTTTNPYEPSSESAGRMQTLKISPPLSGSFDHVSGTSKSREVAETTSLPESLSKPSYDQVEPFLKFFLEIDQNFNRFHWKNTLSRTKKRIKSFKESAKDFELINCGSLKTDYFTDKNAEQAKLTAFRTLGF